MTTYTLSGIAIQFSDTGTPVDVSTSALTFTTDGSANPSFGYDIAVEFADDLPFVYLDVDALHRLQVQSTFDEGWWRLSRTPGLYLDYEIGTIFWGAGKETTVFRITNSRDDVVHVFALAGDPLPQMTTVSNVRAFDNSTDGAATASAASGAGPDQSIALANLPGITSTEDDHFYFSADFSIPFDAGPGNDLIEVQADQSDVAGGTGDDRLKFFGFNFYEVTATLIEGGVHLIGTWYDHIIRDDVETIEFNFGETYTYAEMVALIPGTPQLLEGDADDNLLEGADGRDTLRGFDGDDHLIGGGFEDLLEGGDGDDLLEGGDGADTIDTGDGVDLAEGGEGGDLIYLGTDGTHGSGYYAWNADAPWQVGTDIRVSVTGLNRVAAVTNGGAEIDFVYLSNGPTAFFLHDSFSAFHRGVALHADHLGNDSAARFNSVEYIVAGASDDVIDLTSPDYSLAGQEIIVVGGAGNDVIWGADSDDSLSGQDGNDTLFGGAGSDTLRGGAGADSFEFTRTSTDVLIRDFDAADGDTLVFYDRGGATFDAGSLAMTALGFTIDYLDADSGLTETLTVRLAQYDYMMTATLDDVTNAFLIV